jgi:TatD DNase family protein
VYDTHCHIYLEEFDEDRDEVLERAHGAGITRIYMPAINLESLNRMDRVGHPAIEFFRMAGLHPTQLNQGEQIKESDLYEICREDNIIAVGETGLDYYWSDKFKEEQKNSLRMHCRIAKAVGKPVVLHNRSSTGDLLDIIEEEQDGTLAGVWHCFTGSVKEGKRAIDLGMMLGIGGITTFKNAGVDKAVAKLPLDKMILETDAPYLAPVPNRGKRNEPAYIRYIAEKLAELFDRKSSEIERITNANAQSLFHS